MVIVSSWRHKKKVRLENPGNTAYLCHLSNQVAKIGAKRINLFLQAVLGLFASLLQQAIIKLHYVLWYAPAIFEEKNFCHQTIFYPIFSLLIDRPKLIDRASEWNVISRIDSIDNETIQYRTIYFVLTRKRHLLAKYVQTYHYPQK